MNEELKLYYSLLSELTALNEQNIGDNGLVLMPMRLFY
jgi:hypothetical protein